MGTQSSVLFEPLRWVNHLTIAPLSGCNRRPYRNSDHKWS